MRIIQAFSSGCAGCHSHLGLGNNAPSKCSKCETCLFPQKMLLCDDDNSLSVNVSLMDSK